MPKPTSKRWQVSAEKAEGSEWRRIGRAHYAQSSIRAQFIPLTSEDDIDNDRPKAEMLIALDERNIPQVYDVAIHASEEPLTPTSTRLPLRAMTRAAVACLSYRLEGDTAHLVAVPGDTFTFANDKVTVEHLASQRLAELERDARMRPRANPVTEDELQRVATIIARVPYRERRDAVATELGVSRYVAKSRIAEARRRGLLA